MCKFKNLCVYLEKLNKQNILRIVHMLFFNRSYFIELHKLFYT